MSVEKEVEMDIGQILWFSILTVANGVMLVLIRIQAKKNGQVRYNPHPPGESRTCMKHAERLAGIETDVKNIKEDIREIKKTIR